MAMASEQSAREKVSSASGNEPRPSRKAPSSAEFPPPFLRPQGAPRRPSAEEMIDYYSRKGLDKQAAAEKVIDDLQKALTLAVGRRFPKKAREGEKPPVRSVVGTLDSLSNRLGDVEAKMDAKPGLGGVFVAGVAAGGLLQAVPHVFRAVTQIGRSLKEATSSKP